MTISDEERREWGVEEWEKPYGLAFFSDIGEGWFFENEEGQDFRALEISTIYFPEENEYFVKVSIYDLESVGSFVVKNHNYSGEYTFTSIIG